ncbi:MAG TPA: ATP-binding protein [Candidatus Binatia bacterium]|jgi:two-component system sensor histidine kinase KdpD
MKKPRTGKFDTLGPTPLREYALAVVYTAAATVTSLALEPIIGHRPIGLLYLLLVVAVGVKLHRGPVLLVAACSTIIWDLLFIPPYFTLHIATGEDLMLFTTFFVVALAMGHLTTRLRQAEIVETSARFQRALLQSVSHELKSPLSAVQAGVDVLAKEIGTHENCASVLHTTQQALRRLRRVIDNLLDMSRLEAEVMHPALDWSDVADLVRAAIRLTDDALKAHVVAIEADENLPMVKVDQALLEQSLCNLLLNAAANSPAGSKIVVRAACKGGNLTLSVLDEGKGIPENDLPHIFRGFYRGDGAAPGGTGLGLAIVEGFTRAHGGKVSAFNRHTGGAEIAITIPVETLKWKPMEEVA